MPRPKKESPAEPKKRSRTGCWPCKSRKVKCGEEKPACSNCVKSGETCDYSIRLNWSGRANRSNKDMLPGEGGFTFVSTPTSDSPARQKHGSGHEHVFSAQHIAAAPKGTGMARPQSSRSAADIPTPDATPREERLDPQLRYELPLPVPVVGQYSPRNPSQQHDGLPGRSVPQYPISEERSSYNEEEFKWSPQHGHKRVKLSPSLTRSAPSPVFAVPQYPAQPSPGSATATTHYTPHSIASKVHTPATPGSSIASPQLPSTHTSGLTVQDPRRLSVKSLLSDPDPSPDEGRRNMAIGSGAGWRIHGYDHGLPDLDLPRNEDVSALLPRSPDMRRASAAPSATGSSSSEDGDKSLMAFESGGYYAKPVPVKLPRSWEPLPQELRDSPMNLLYFHHFINHTGRIMVPHDCPENPFRSVLPRMALANQHLLHLLLTYSASHRARLLDHPEPANRIAEWMGDVLPALRRALNEPTSPGEFRDGRVRDPGDPSSLAPLATAIMLASLEIVSPNTFAVSIPWQNHLQIARQMIVAKGGLHHLAQQADGARDKAIFFLSRWFAYLDVLGSLSGSKQDQPLYGAYLEDGGGLWLVNRRDEEIYQIDCLFGFSGRCIALLAQVAELAGRCDKVRIDPITNRVKADWRPEAEVREQAEELRKRLTASAKTVFRGCSHSGPIEEADFPHGDGEEEAKSETDIAEIYATNEAYHYAGLIHLSRRVLALPPSDAGVQANVAKVMDALTRVRRGSTAESCLLFPMFTAGCEAQTMEEREVFMERLRGIEGWGLQHVGRARAIMRRVWEEGREWGELVDGEFFG